MYECTNKEKTKLWYVIYSNCCKYKWTIELYVKNQWFMELYEVIQAVRYIRRCQAIRYKQFIEIA